MAEENNIVIKTEREWGCLGVLLVFVVGLIVGFCCARRYFRDATKMIERDTTYIHDTTRILLPKETKYIKITDTLRVPVKDTVVLRDTTYVVLQKEVKEYRGEDYYAKVSGYKPMLDYIEVYPKTTIIKETIEKNNKKTISVGAEVGYMRHGYIPLFVQYENRPQYWLSIYGRVEYDMLQQNLGVRVGTKLNFGI